jgi:ELWxxDGT repeat protein
MFLSAPVAHAQARVYFGPAELISELSRSTDDLRVFDDRLVFGNQLFFTAADGRQGIELGVTDGTATGTRMIDINPGPDSSSPHSFAMWDDAVYLIAERNAGNFGIRQSYLYRTDGTADGTIQIAPAATRGPTDQARLVATTSGLFFIGEQANSGPELWFSDGTAAGTRLVRDIFPGPSSSGIQHLTAVGERVFFAASSAEDESGLWVSDGTSAGTRIISPSTPLGSMVAVDDRVFFTRGVHFIQQLAGYTYTDYELWTSDGTTNGTRVVRRFYEPPATTVLAAEPANFPNQIQVLNQLTVVQDRLLFSINLASVVLYPDDHDTTSDGLWAFADNTLHQLSTQRVWQIEPAGSDAVVLEMPTDPDNAQRVLRSDGTPAGTEVLYQGNNISSVMPVGDALYMLSNSVAPMRIDHRSAAGVVTTVYTHDVPIDAAGLAMTALGNQLLFLGNDLAHGSEWWRSDGTPTGTGMIVDLNTTNQSDNPTLLMEVGNKVFFVTNMTWNVSRSAPALWVADSAGDAPRKLTDLARNLNDGMPTTVGDRLFMRFWNSTPTDITEPISLLISDGTAAGTQVTPTNATHQGPFVPLRDRVFYTAYVDQHKLWATDGTPAGTEEVYAFDTGRIGAITLWDDQLLILVQNDARTAFELWRSDGTASGTVRFYHATADENEQFNPFSFTLAVGSGTAFVNYSRFIPNRSRTELLRTDGTPEGTTVVELPFPQEQPSAHTAQIRTAFGNQVILEEQTWSGQPVAIWVSDGTLAGTNRLVLPGETAPAEPAAPELIKPFNDGVIIVKETTGARRGPQHYWDVWFTDGTPDGGHLLLTLPYWQYIEQIQVLHGRALFHIAQYSWPEPPASMLWSTDGTSAGTRMVQFFPRGFRQGQPFTMAYADGALLLNPVTADHGGSLWAIRDNVHLRTTTASGAEPGAMVSIPITVDANHAAVTGDLTVDLQIDPALELVAPAQTTQSLTFSGMGYLDQRTQFITVRLPAAAVIGDTYTITATLRGAPTNDPTADNSVTINVRAAQQVYLPIIRR